MFDLYTVFGLPKLIAISSLPSKLFVENPNQNLAVFKISVKRFLARVLFLMLCFALS